MHLFRLISDWKIGDWTENGFELWGFVLAGNEGAEQDARQRRDANGTRRGRQEIA